MRATLITPGLVLAALAGCGGGSTLSHDEFVSAANGICDRAEAELEELQGRFAEASADQRRVIAVELSQRSGKRVAECSRSKPATPPTSVCWVSCARAPSRPKSSPGRATSSWVLRSPRPAERFGRSSERAGIDACADI